MKTSLKGILVFILFLYCYSSQAQIISTIAGNGLPGYTGDGFYATGARLNLPEGVAVDDSGNVYIAVYWNYAIRKVDRSGIIRTIAGTGVSGYTGDGGPAINARISPATLVRDKKGNLYIGDVNHGCVRKIDSAGIITTIAGTGTNGYSGDGGPATAAQLNYPQGLDVDAAGNVYIADEVNHRIRKIDTSGIITTIAGTGAEGFSGDGGQAASATFSYPTGVTVDNNGNIYVVDYNNERIRKIDASGMINTIAGTGQDGFGGDGGPATLAQLSSPVNMAIDKVGNLYIADDANNRVRKIDTAGIISTLAGNGDLSYGGDGGAAALAALAAPNAVAVDALGNVYVADMNNNRVRKISGISGSVDLCMGGSAALHEEISGGKWYSESPNIASIDSVSGQLAAVSTGNTTVYYVIWQDTVSTPVSVIDTLPTVETIAGPNTLCGLDSVAMYTDGTAGGVWTATNANGIMANGFLTAASYGQDTIIYTKTNACGVAADSVVVDIKAPSAGVIWGTPVGCPGEMIMLADYAANGIWASSDTSIASIDTTGMVHALRDGSSIISYTVNDAGCSVSASLHFKVHTPDAGTISGLTNVCAGSSILLSDTSGGGAWVSTNTNVAIIDSAGILNGINAGTDTIKYIIASGACRDTASLPLHVYKADAGIITGLTSVCPGDSILLSNTLGGGAWVSMNTNVASIDSTGMLKGISAGTDTISYIVTSNGCSDTATYAVSVKSEGECGDGVALISTVEGMIDVFPNPTKGSITVRFPGIKKPAMIAVYDLTGREVVRKTLEVHTSESELNLDKLARGTYLLRISGPEFKALQKITLE